MPIGLSGAGQGAYEATYAVGSMFCALLAPLIYRTENALWVWLTVGLLSSIAAIAAIATAGADRSTIVHMNELHDSSVEPHHAAADAPSCQAIPDSVPEASSATGS